MNRDKALAMLAAGAPGPDASVEDRAAFLHALNRLASEHVSTAEIEGVTTAELSALRACDAARAQTDRVLAAALRS